MPPHVRREISQRENSRDQNARCLSPGYRTNIGFIDSVAPFSIPIPSAVRKPAIITCGSNVVRVWNDPVAVNKNK